MPMDDLLSYLLPRAPSLVATLVVTALPMAAAALLAPPRRRTVPAVLAGTGLLLGSIALVSTPGLHGPFLYDPAVLTARRVAHTTAGSVLIAGTLCLLAVVVLILLRPGGGRPRIVLGAAAGVGIGAAAIPAAVLTATAGGMDLLSLHTDAQLASIPAGLILAASVCVGALGAGVWLMAGRYWADPARENPGGASRDSSSRSS